MLLARRPARHGSEHLQSALDAIPSFVEMLGRGAAIRQRIACEDAERRPLAFRRALAPRRFDGSGTATSDGTPAAIGSPQLPYPGPEDHPGVRSAGLALAQELAVTVIEPFASDRDGPTYEVRYEPWNAALPAVFDALSTLIRGVAGPIAIEHVGSTAVPGLGGRNVLDVAIPVGEDALPGLRQAMHDLGFQDSPFPHYLPLLVGRFSSNGGSHPVLLYLVAEESDVYRNWLAFRNHLLANPDAARAYDAVKRDVLGEHGLEGERYQEAKTPFIASLSTRLRGS